MVGVSPRMHGGIAAVAATLLDAGLAQSVPLVYLNTYAEGGRAAKAGRFALALLQLLGHLLRGRVRLVHAHVASNGSFWRKSVLLGLVRAFGVPTVFHLHGGGFADFAAQTPRNWMQRWIRHSLQASSRVAVLSSSWAQWVQKFAPGAAVVISPNPIHIPTDEQLVSLKRPLGGEGRILYLGLIVPRKGTFDLLEAWQRASRDCPGWRLQVGGNGDWDGLRRRADELGISSSLDALGWISGDDKARALAQADLFVLPSYKEGVPMSILEAMAHGVAVVATAVGGTPDIVDHDCDGWLVAPGQVPELAAAMTLLVNDPVRRARLGCAGRVRVQQVNAADVAVLRWCALYQQLAPSGSEDQSPAAGGKGRVG